MSTCLHLLSFMLLLLLLLSHFSHVRLCVTPQMAAHQAPLSLGLGIRVRVAPLTLHSWCRFLYQSGAPGDRSHSSSQRKFKINNGSLTQHCKSTAAAAKSLQSCPTLCDPIDGSPPGSPVPGILQARTLEWVAISFSNA